MWETLKSVSGIDPSLWGKTFSSEGSRRWIPSRMGCSVSSSETEALTVVDLVESRSLSVEDDKSCPGSGPTRNSDVDPSRTGERRRSSLWFLVGEVSWSCPVFEPVLSCLSW